MSRAFRAFGEAIGLVRAGDLPELFRRLRVRVCGNASLGPDDSSHIEAFLRGFEGRPSISIAREDTPCADSRPSSGPVRALVFAHSLALEGAPISQFELTRDLVGKGSLSAEVVAFGDGPLRHEYELIGVPVIVCRPYLGRISTEKRLHAVVAEIAQLMEARKPEVVYANTLLTFGVVLAAAKMGIPSIWNVRESEDWNSYFGFLNRSIALHALKALTLPFKVVFVSEASRNVWSKFDVKKNFVLIRNGLDLTRLGRADAESSRGAFRQLLGFLDDDIVFLCVGTICERKGQRDLVRALELLPIEIAKRVRVCLAGTEILEYGKALRRDIALLPIDLQTRILLQPVQGRISRYYASADVFVLCSRTESYPRVTLEAMAFGLPILATPVFGVVEQLSEQEGAMYYAPGDGEQLAKCMARIATDRQLRQDMAMRSSQKLLTLSSFEQMTAAYNALFHGARFKEAEMANFVSRHYLE